MGMLVIGLSLGLLLFLAAAGLTIVFGMLRVVNFAHGAFYMLGAYLAWQAVTWTGSFGLAIVVAVLIVGLLGLAAERWLLRPLHDKPHAFQLLLTFGLVLVIEEAVRFYWGDFKLLEAPTALSGYIELGTSRIGIYRIFVCAIASASAASLMFVLEFTLLGAVVHAAAANPNMLSCMGVNVNRVRTIVFGVGVALGALAGALAAPLVPMNSEMGVSVIIDCFIVVLVGGLGNIRGAIFAALFLGMARAFGQEFMPQSIDVLTYTLLVGVLVLRPEGLFGRRSRSA